MKYEDDYLDKEDLEDEGKLGSVLSEEEDDFVSPLSDEDIFEEPEDFTNSDEESMY